MPLSLPDKRERNRSLCTLYTPPPYPGYAAILRTPLSLSQARSVSMERSKLLFSAASSTASLKTTSPETPLQTPSPLHQSSALRSPISEEPHSPLPRPLAKRSNVSKASSGYGSSSSSSEAETSPLKDSGLVRVERTAEVVRVSRPPLKEHRRRTHWRRLSVPANPRQLYTEDVLRVLQDQQVHIPQFLLGSADGRGRTVGVMEMARDFGRTSAQQSRIPHGPVGRNARKEGGIAALGSEESGMAQRIPTKVVQSPSAAPASAGGGGGPVNRSPSSIKEALLRWCQIKTKDYPSVNITNFSSSWADGMAFAALLHHFRPQAFDFAALNPARRAENLALVFAKAEELADIAPLLEVEDMLLMGDKPDWKCIFTQVQGYYKAFRNEE